MLVKTGHGLGSNLLEDCLYWNYFLISSVFISSNSSTFRDKTPGPIFTNKFSLNLKFILIFILKWNTHQVTMLLKVVSSLRFTLKNVLRFKMLMTTGLMLVLWKHTSFIKTDIWSYGISSRTTCLCKVKGVGTCKQMNKNFSVETLRL